MIVLNICVSDLPKDKIITGRNGKKYINLVLDERREVSQFGETHTITLSQSKEEREAKATKVFVGGGKEYVFERREQPQPKAQPQPARQAGSSEIDDLPF